MNKIIESAWIELLTKATKKQETASGTAGNDGVDLYVPQSRLLALAESNRAIPRLIYLSAQDSAKKNAYLIVRKLGMPSDYFWKFEFWPQERAYTTLAKIVHRIFTTIMNEAREGKLVVKELTIEPLQIRIDFESCVECAGISGLKHGICYYHAGTFAGIIAALLNLEDLDCYETSCHSSGSESCSFVLGAKTNKDFVRNFEVFLSPPEIKIDLLDRLSSSLKKDSVRSLGNMVDANYLRLVTANILLDNPRLFSDMNSEVGNHFGHTISGIVDKFYSGEKWKEVENYYRDVCRLNLEIIDKNSEVQVTVKETSTTVYSTKEMASFLEGELSGLISGLTGKEMKVKESRFTGDGLVIILVP